MIINNDNNITIIIYIYTNYNVTKHTHGREYQLYWPFNKVGNTIPIQY